MDKNSVAGEAECDGELRGYQLNVGPGERMVDEGFRGGEIEMLEN